MTRKMLCVLLGVGMMVCVSAVSMRRVRAERAGAPGMMAAAGANPYSGCITPFWDSQQYGWLAFKNSCTEPLNLIWYFKQNPPDIIGSGGNVQPGRSINTGYSPSEVRARGGYELYVCPVDQIPVDGNGRMIHYGGTPQEYSCKP